MIALINLVYILLVSFIVYILFGAIETFNVFEWSEKLIVTSLTIIALSEIYFLFLYLKDLYESN